MDPDTQAIIVQPSPDNTVGLSVDAPVIKVHDEDEHNVNLIVENNTARVVAYEGAEVNLQGDGNIIEVTDRRSTGATGPSGPAGETGPRGIQGERGFTGERGLAGPSGPMGPRGQQGERGLRGESGPTGAQGNTGATGNTGAKGDKGIRGERGYTGETGPAGPRGLSGPEGLIGPAGRDGAPGAQGPTGAKGDTGQLGYTGPTGPRGLAGATGPKGDKGNPGIDGTDGQDGARGATGPKGETGPRGLTGETGPAGPTGSQGIQGIPGETGPAGIDGDDGANGASAYQIWLAQGNTGTELDYLASIKGETGQTGPQGEQGIQGVQGLDGATGPRGLQGTPGIDGATGPKGDQGDIGATGPQGLQGLTGPKGDAGIDGATGPSGPAGADGNDGADGTPGLPGPIGATGPQGLPGTDGIDGIDGATGPKGDTGDRGLTGFTGPQGLQGDDGAKGDTGSTGPKGDQGIAGPTGPKGDTGTTGIDGATGPQGLQGPAGATGPKGNIGNTGPAGTPGLAGATGPRGLTGPQGLTGPKGDKGDTGAQGPSGPAGATGPINPNAVVGPATSTNNYLTAFSGAGGKTLKQIPVEFIEDTFEQRRLLIIRNDILWDTAYLELGTDRILLNAAVLDIEAPAIWIKCYQAGQTLTLSSSYVDIYGADGINLISVNSDIVLQGDEVRVNSSKMRYGASVDLNNVDDPEDFVHKKYVDDQIAAIPPPVSDGWDQRTGDFMIYPSPRSAYYFQRTTRFNVEDISGLQLGDRIKMQVAGEPSKIYYGVIIDITDAFVNPPVTPHPNAVTVFFPSNTLWATTGHQPMMENGTYFNWWTSYHKAPRGFPLDYSNGGNFSGALDPAADIWSISWTDPESKDYSEAGPTPDVWYAVMKDEYNLIKGLTVPKGLWDFSIQADIVIVNVSTNTPARRRSSIESGLFRGGATGTPIRGSWTHHEWEVRPDLGNVFYTTNQASFRAYIPQTDSLCMRIRTRVSYLETIRLHTSRIPCTITATCAYI